MSSPDIPVAVRDRTLRGDRFWQDHAESVRITYDPSQISYSQLLRSTFGGDPTQLNRQGPDWGTQYRSAIFFTNDESRTGRASLYRLNKAQIFRKPIVTQFP